MADYESHLLTLITNNMDTACSLNYIYLLGFRHPNGNLMLHNNPHTNVENNGCDRQSVFHRE